MRSDNLERWHGRLANAATLIEGRLDDPPTLGELSSAACVSPFHFHRIWRGLTGETVGGTIARLRAEAAGEMLAKGAMSVTEVAMATGFSTSQSFARAFRSQTGGTASAARGAPVTPTISPGGHPEVAVVMRNGMQVVALRRVGGAYVELNATFQRVWDWAEQAGLLEGLNGLFGVPLDDPESVPEEALRYDACLALGEVEPTLPLRLVTLPGGPHALLSHRGRYDSLEQLDQWLVGRWLPNSGHEPADAPIYHHFHNDPEATPEQDLVTDILLPLREEEPA